MTKSHAKEILELAFQSAVCLRVGLTEFSLWGKVKVRFHSMCLSNRITLNIMLEILRVIYLFIVPLNYLSKIYLRFYFEFSKKKYSLTKSIDKSL